MEKIKSISLSRMRNNEHFQFMTDFDTLVVRYQPEELLIGSLHPVFKALLTDEDAAMRVELGSSITLPLENYDQGRDDTWSAVSLKIDANLRSPIESEKAYAQELDRVMRQYGDVRGLSYNEESAAIGNLVNDLLKTEHEAALTALGVLAWVTELKNQNEQFQALFNERNTELSGREGGNVKAIRARIDPVYEKITERIHSSMVMEVAKPAATNFVAELNELISYYKNTMAIRAANNKKSADAVKNKKL